LHRVISEQEVESFGIFLGLRVFHATNPLFIEKRLYISKKKKAPDGAINMAG